MAISQINQNSLASGVPSSIASSALPAGTVLQVVNATYTTETSNSTGTYADTGLTASITPRSTSSRILILINLITIKDTGSSGNGLKMNICRNGSEIVQFSQRNSWTNTALYVVNNIAYNYVDSPSSASSVAYKVQFANNTPSNAVYVQWDNRPSSIQLLEIAG
jgi:hypothetical protein